MATRRDFSRATLRIELCSPDTRTTTRTSVVLSPLGATSFYAVQGVPGRPVLPAALSGTRVLFLPRRAPRLVVVWV